jgi:hypothetical protein
MNWVLSQRRIMALRIKSKPVQNKGEINACNVLRLTERPVVGNFDVAHLREINQRVLDGILKLCQWIKLC